MTASMNQNFEDMETGKLPEPHCVGGYVDFRVKLDQLHDSKWH